VIRCRLITRLITFSDGFDERLRRRDIQAWEEHRSSFWQEFCTVFRVVVTLQALEPFETAVREDRNVALLDLAKHFTFHIQLEASANSEAEGPHTITRTKLPKSLLEHFAAARASYRKWLQS